MSGVSLQEFSRLLWRRKLLIASAGIVCAALAVAAGKSLTPRYSAVAQLYVDPRDPQIGDRGLPRAQDLSGMVMVVESQARLITSNNVLLKVVQQNKLDSDPEFSGSGSPGFAETLLHFAGLRSHPPEPAHATQSGALEALTRHITVRNSERSFIVDVDVWSRDPAKAATLANAVSKAYLSEIQNEEPGPARPTSDLPGQINEARTRLRNAETTLGTYKAQHKLVSPHDILISDQQLSDSSQRLAAAAAAAFDAQSRYDQIEASRRGADGGAIPEALQSAAMANMRAQYAEVRARYAELSTELGPRHPVLRQAERQVEDLRRTIDEEVSRFALAAKNDLTRARDYEASLSKALEAQKRRSAELTEAAAQQRDLEREVETTREAYQALLKRPPETDDQTRRNISATRLIGEAAIPQRRTFPPSISVMAMLGSMFGLLAAAAWTLAARKEAPKTDPKGPTWKWKWENAQPEPSLPRADVPYPVSPTASKLPPPTLMFVETPIAARSEDGVAWRRAAGL